ncbi:transposable element-related [Holotrichia oblita]|uniref:Transposable element-related n=1 Tax=Holotrichia oblita TaxID=644536 RepID=A0ACB9TAU3_HOLOL|nr:transposable element-related [Holotrichia oblita]
MPKIRELTQAERGQIVLLHSQNMSLAAIAKQMKCSRCAVRTTIKRYQDTGSFTNRRKSGRRRSTTARQDRLLERISLRDRKKSSKDLSSELQIEHGISISAHTVRRRLYNASLRGCRARQKPYLTEKHKKNRLLWAKQYSNWTVDDWIKVMWSDESNIEVSVMRASGF